MKTAQSGSWHDFTVMIYRGMKAKKLVDMRVKCSVRGFTERLRTRKLMGTDIEIFEWGVQALDVREEPRFNGDRLTEMGIFIGSC